MREGATPLGASPGGASPGGPTPLGVTPGHAAVGSPPPWPAPEPDGVRAARRHEERVRRRGHPLGWALTALAGRRGAVARVPGLGVLVSGAPELRTVLRDPDRFRKDGRRGSTAVVTQIMGPHALMNMEGPDHQELRRRLQGLFHEDAAGALVRAVLEPVLDETGARLTSGEGVDLAHLARLVSGRTMLHLVGVEGIERDDPARALEAYRLGTRLVGMLSLRMRPLGRRRLREAREVYEALVAPAATAWRRADEASIPGRLREMGLGLDEARGVMGMLLIAGMETTATAIPRLAALLSDARYWPHVRAGAGDPELLVDEGLRVVTPLPAVTRTVAARTELGGRTLREGDLLLGVLHNALRDPRLVPHGGDFAPHRPIPPEIRHLWFGAGPHFCLGMVLARIQLRTLVERLGRVAPDLRVVERAEARGVLLPNYRRLVVAAGVPR